MRTVHGGKDKARTRNISSKNRDLILRLRPRMRLGLRGTMAIQHGNHHCLLAHHHRCKQMDCQVLQYLYHLVRAHLLKVMVVGNLPGLKTAEVDKMVEALVVPEAAEVGVVGTVEEEANECLHIVRARGSSLKHSM